ncbi:thiamine phosphate synthase [Kordiimonas aquimaris]|uniref:thiamine phosphate synthase n=1 Tax=Kordiimonas aquimaris TaxID=707591 RepID=UPI0021CF9274|nr:thiamine phosphate synthase [Kordiimonas aquimaris]
MVKADQVKSAQKCVLGVAARVGVRQLVFMTDAKNIAQTVRSLELLPCGSVVIFRAYNNPDRKDCARFVLQHAHACGHLFLIARDVRLARILRADGVHLPEYMLRGTRPNFFGFNFVTAACHNLAALQRAARFSVDLALVSPAFQTQSHTDQQGLGVHRFARLVKNAPLPVAALGGVNVKTAGKLRGLGLMAVAGISGII